MLRPERDGDVWGHEWEKARHVFALACATMILLWFSVTVAPLLPKEWDWVQPMTYTMSAGSAWFILPIAASVVGRVFPWWKDDHFLQWPRFWWGLDKCLRTIIVGFSLAASLWVVQKSGVTGWENEEAWREAILQAMYGCIGWGVIGLARVSGEPGKAPKRLSEVEKAPVPAADLSRSN